MGDKNKVKFLLGADRLTIEPERVKDELSTVQVDKIYLLY